MKRLYELDHLSLKVVGRITSLSKDIFFLIIAAIFVVPLILTGCGKQTCSCVTVTPPEITLTGPKTSIERQIMGSYREIEKDAWVISSAKGKGFASGSQDSDVALFRAFSILDESQKDLQEYQRQGVLGENNKGLLEKVSNKYDQEEKAKRQLEVLASKVNNARKAIFQIMATDVKEFRMTLDDIGAVFAEKYFQTAPVGTMLQSKNGQWLQKKK